MQCSPTVFCELRISRKLCARSECLSPSVIAPGNKAEFRGFCHFCPDRQYALRLRLSVSSSEVIQFHCSHGPLAHYNIRPIILWYAYCMLSELDSVSHDCGGLVVSGRACLPPQFNHRHKLGTSASSDPFAPHPDSHRLPTDLGCLNPRRTLHVVHRRHWKYSRIWQQMKCPRGRKASNRCNRVTTLARLHPVTKSMLVMLKHCDANLCNWPFRCIPQSFYTPSRFNCAVDLPLELTSTAAILEAWQHGNKHTHTHTEACFAENFTRRSPADCHFGKMQDASCPSCSAACALPSEEKRKRQRKERADRKEAEKAKLIFQSLSAHAACCDACRFPDNIYIGAKSGGIEEAEELEEAGALSLSRDTTLMAEGSRVASVCFVKMTHEGNQAQTSANPRSNGQRGQLCNLDFCCTDALCNICRAGFHSRPSRPGR